MPVSARITATVATLILGAPVAHADVVISSGATQNMTCSAGVCAPTSSDAVLNVSYLEALLASGNVEVTTTGSGVQADSVSVGAALTWSSTSTLSLDAYGSIAIDRRVSVAGLSGMALTTNDGGSGGMLSFGPQGNVEFASLASQLVINGVTYTLVGTIETLASDIAAAPSDNFALAADYDASSDGEFAAPPIVTPFPGNLQGLGNSISHLKIAGHRHKLGAGLFAEIEGSVENVNLRRVDISEKEQWGEAGGIAAYSQGLLSGIHVDGKIAGAADNAVGGVVGYNYGTILISSSTATIHGGEGSDCGGVVGLSRGTISQSFAGGAVGWDKGCQFAGGLVGENLGTISNTYATGGVIGGLYETEGGGLIGENDTQVSTSYSTGHVEAEYLGGFVGYQYSGSCSADCYWDTQTSGTDLGAGYGNESNITGLASKQLRSQLPAGLDPTIWAQDKKNNDGFPYLINNPPPK